MHTDYRTHTRTGLRGKKAELYCPKSRFNFFLKKCSKPQPHTIHTLDGVVDPDVVVLVAVVEEGVRPPLEGVRGASKDVDWQEKQNKFKMKNTQHQANEMLTTSGVAFELS